MENFKGTMTRYDGPIIWSEYFENLPSGNLT